MENENESLEESFKIDDDLLKLGVTVDEQIKIFETKQNVKSKLNFLNKISSKRVYNIKNQIEEKLFDLQNKVLKLEEKNKELVDQLYECEQREPQTVDHQSFKLRRKLFSLKIKKEQISTSFQEVKKEKQLTDQKYQSLGVSKLPMRWSSEVIWASVFIGFVFDFLLWQSIFEGRFDLGALSTAATRASAVVCSLSYAYVCSQLGVSLCVKSFIRSKKDTKNLTQIEKFVYSKCCAKQTFGIWFTLFILLTGVSFLGRFTQDGTGADQILLSLVSFSISLVVSAIAYQYHDVYDHFYREVKPIKLKTDNKFIGLNEKLNDLDYEIRLSEFDLENEYYKVD